MGSLSIWHWIIVIAVVLLVFGGRGKISDLMGDVAKGIKAFKKGMAEDDSADAGAKADAPVKSIDHQAGRREAARGPRARSRARCPDRPLRLSPSASVPVGAIGGMTRMPSRRMPHRRLSAERAAEPAGEFPCSISVGPNSLLIGVVALIVIGPKELPAVMRTVGQWTRKVRSMAAEFQNQFQEAMREAEMADLKKQVDDMAQDIKQLDPLKDVRDDVERVGKDVEIVARPATAPKAKPRIGGSCRAESAAGEPVRRARRRRRRCRPPPSR